MANLDLKKEMKHLYNPSTKEISLVDVPPLSFLMIDGAGDPNTSKEYSDAVSSLYTLAYGIRAISKEAGTVYTVMPLEGLWWWADMDAHAEGNTLTSRDKSDFLWTMMILQPGHITAQMVEAARETVRKKKNPPCLDDIRFETYHEGEAAQVMYRGSYADEGPTIQRLHAYIAEKGYELGGKHHEIYLSNPDRVEPAKLKTVIRQPMRKA